MGFWVGQNSPEAENYTPFVFGQDFDADVSCGPCRPTGNSAGGGDSNPVSQTENLQSCRLDDLPFPYSRRNLAIFKGRRSTTRLRQHEPLTSRACISVTESP